MKNISFLVVILFFVFTFPTSCKKKSVDIGLPSLDENFSAKDGSGQDGFDLFVEDVQGTVFEDAEDFDISGWEVYDKTPEGAEIRNVFDEEKKSRVIEFSGDGTANGYRLRNKDMSKWENADQFVAGWRMKFDAPYVVYFDTETTKGHRYIYYTADDYHKLGDDEYVHHGFGNHTRNGEWHVFVCDLQADLAEAQQEAEILKVNGFLIRGNGRIDDLKFFSSDVNFLVASKIGTGSGKIVSEPPVIDCGSQCFHILRKGNLLFKAVPDAGSYFMGWGSNGCENSASCMLSIDSNTLVTAVFKSDGIYEDAEDGKIAGWEVYDNDPEGAMIKNSIDEEKGKVIEFFGEGTENGYRLRKSDMSLWKNPSHLLQWSMKSCEPPVVYIDTETTAGHRYIYYTSALIDKLGEDEYIHHGLGEETKDCLWHTFSVNLQADLEEAQPGVRLLEVNGFLVRGNLMIDDIRLFDSSFSFLGVKKEGKGCGYIKSSTPDIDCGTDCMEIYENKNDRKVILTATARPGSDFQGWSIEECGRSEACEINLSSDTIVKAVFGSDGVYEDAEDGETTGWEIYDKDPEGALINNVFDEDRESRVIEFSGAARNNGYRLRRYDLGKWQNLSKYVKWSLKYSEPFTLYLDVETSAGHRYIYYTPSETSKLGLERYVHFGLGLESMDGKWHTFTRNIQEDLERAQPGVTILEINGFLIRGSGRVDDIAIHN